MDSFAITQAAEKDGSKPKKEPKVKWRRVEQPSITIRLGHTGILILYSPTPIQLDQFPIIDTYLIH